MSDAFTGGPIYCWGRGMIHVSHAERQWTYESAQEAVSGLPSGAVPLNASLPSADVLAQSGSSAASGLQRTGFPLEPHHVASALS